MLSYSIYTVAERSHRSTVVIVNFEHILLSSSVSAVDCEHVFIFWFWSFYILIVFRLRSNQVPFIYRKNFYEVKYFREVSCTVPRKMSGEKSRGNCAGGNSWAGNCPGGNYSEVTVQGYFSWGNFIGDNFPGHSWPGGNIWITQSMMTKNLCEASFIDHINLVENQLSRPTPLSITIRGVFRT